MNPGALLFLEVPNETDIWVQSQIEWKMRGLGHLNYFKPEALENILRRAGFSEVTVSVSGKLVKKHMAALQPRKSIIQRIQRKIAAALRLRRPLPDYMPKPPQEERIFIQCIALNADN